MNENDILKDCTPAIDNEAARSILEVLLKALGYEKHEDGSWRSPVETSPQWGGSNPKAEESEG